MNVKLISLTNDSRLATPEALIAYCARVSSPNQNNSNIEGLLKYCIKEKHWSIFEMVDMTVEITTSRAIAAQILRHRSFNFQEFSQRYAEVQGYEPCEARRQDVKNRQNSIDDLDDYTKDWFLRAQKHLFEYSSKAYQNALEKGIAKECARMFLPLNTQTRLYMKGSVRSWIHYLEVRCHPSCQKEHRDVANSIKTIFCEEFPLISEALNWRQTEN